MQYRIGAVLVLGLVLVAGCVTPVGGSLGTADPANDDQRAPLATDSAITSNSVTGSEPVIVAVETDGQSGNATAYVEEAMAYWANASDDRRRYLVVPDLVPGDGNVSALLPGLVEPDVGVRFANGTLACGSDGTSRYFCTEQPAHGPATATISPGLTDDGFEAAVIAAVGRLQGHDSPLDRSDLGAPAFADPWPASDPVTVTVENEVASDRDFEPLVEETLRWWEERDDEWGNYTTNWRLVDGPDADVTVAVVDRVQRCGGHPNPGSLLGCAPVLDAGQPADETERIRIKAGYTDETTLHVLKHEFGHVYGLGHDMAPQEIMSTPIPTTRLSTHNATERDAPWATDTVPVYVDYDSFDAPRATVRAEIDRVLAYYEDGAEGHLSQDVTFRRVDSADDADVTIRSVPELDCMSGSGSCGILKGRNLDADPALERYTGLDVAVSDIDTSALGWHVGRWLGEGLVGADSAADLPPAFADAGADHRRTWHHGRG